MARTTRVPFKNATAAELVVSVEPWGGGYSLPPNAEMEIVVTCDDQAEESFSLEVHADRIIVFGRAPVPMDIDVLKGGQKVPADR